MLLEPFQDRLQIHQVLIVIWARNKHVVYIYETAVQISQDAVHKTLKRLTSVSQTKRHSDEFKCAEGGDNCSFADIFWPHGNLMASFSHVELRENFAPGQPGCQIADVRAGVPVRLCLQIEPPKVPTWLP
jgi:hypothetical protein